jgi:hypothetical protein
MGIGSFQNFCILSALLQGKDAVKNSKTVLKFLEQVNETNMLHHNSRILEVGTLDNDDLVDEFTNDVRDGQDDDIAGSVAVVLGFYSRLPKPQHTNS